MKKICNVILLLLSSSLVFSQTLQQKFIKGNISEKTTAVREANDSESLWLSTTALDFVIENFSYLGEDRELEGLAVAAILSLPNDYGNGKTEIEKNEISNKLLTIYDYFNTSSTVKIAILSKYLLLRSYLPTEPLTKKLNDFIQSSDSFYTDASLMKTIINTLGYIGNNYSFNILYNCYTNNHYAAYKFEIEQTLLNLIPVSMNQILQIIHTKDINKLTIIYNLIINNEKISQNYISEIAENLLNESIIIVGNSTVKKDEVVTIQIGSLKILKDNKCTRASSSVISFFEVAKKEYSDNYLTESQFIEVISSVGLLAPIDSVSYLIEYLEELNKIVESERDVSCNVVIAVINTLGAIGDKTAFDSLLAVTYLNYPDSVLSAARNALAGLKW